MQVLTRRTLRKYWQKNQRAEQPLKVWLQQAERGNWKTPSDVKAVFAAVSFVSDKLVFNIGGNNYRLVARIDYTKRVLKIQFIGTHAEYDKIDVRTL